jgi:hypothetical protein
MRKYLWLAYALPLLALFAIEAAFFTDPWSTWRPFAGFFWVLFAVVVLLSAGVASLVPFFRRDFWAQPDRSAKNLSRRIRSSRRCDRIGTVCSPSPY